MYKKSYLLSNDTKFIIFLCAITIYRYLHDISMQSVLHIIIFRNGWSIYIVL